MKHSSAITLSLIASCGMNCGICIAHLRSTNKCPGCNSTGAGKPRHCNQCSIKHCTELPKSKSNYCFACTKFPCQRLRQLDKRYRANYGMSLIENLRAIEQNGIRKFLQEEHKRWKCAKCGNVLCVHRPECMFCGIPKNSVNKQGLL